MGMDSDDWEARWLVVELDLDGFSSGLLPPCVNECDGALCLFVVIRSQLGVV